MNKHYVPKIEEFHTGFECEVNFKPRLRDLDSLDIYNFHRIKLIKGLRGIHWEKFIDEKRVRVKYLDKEDIESFGFKPTSERAKDIMFAYVTKMVGVIPQEYYLIDRPYYLSEDKWIEKNWKNKVKITHCYIHANSDVRYQIFDGIIENKSELKIILTQIGVIKDE